MRPARSAKAITASVEATVKAVRDGSPEPMARTLAACAAVVDSSAAAIRAAVAAAYGAVAAVAEPDQVAALSMAACWYAQAGGGVHLITTDDRITATFAEPVTEVAAARGAEVGVLTAKTPEPQRRAAYLAPITIGSFLEFGSDYLRDHLRRHPSDVMWRQAAAAVAVDAGAILAADAMTPIYITDNRPVQPIGEAAAEFALRLRFEADYAVRHGRVLFSVAALATVKAALGWADVATAAAVDAAREVERALLLRESLLPVRGLDAVTEITVQGYVRLYDSLCGFTRPGFTDQDLLAELYGLVTLDKRWPRLSFGRPDSWPSQAIIAMERIVDRQRVEFSLLRAAAGSSDVDGTIRELAMAQIRLMTLDRRWREHLARLRFLMFHSRVLYAASRDRQSSFAADAEALYQQARQGVDEEADTTAADVIRSLHDR